MKRLAGFSPDEFERFTLEWIAGYLSAQYVEVQERGGAGDKGRDLVAWKDPSSANPRRYDIYQCKHYDERLGAGKLWVELGKLAYFTHKGDYRVPDTYWVVTHQGVTNDLQDMIDEPEKLKNGLVANWDQHCKDKITKKHPILLVDPIKSHIDSFPFHIVRVLQPHELLSQHAQTGYHLRVFGKPLIDRPPPPKPPSQVADGELTYIRQLYNVIAERLVCTVTCPDDFAHHQLSREVFESARLTFYSAEGLKELARDHMKNERYFDDLMDEFFGGLHMTYLLPYTDGMERMMRTVQQAAVINLGAHELAPLVLANDRAGMCHQLANAQRFRWIRDE